MAKRRASKPPRTSSPPADTAAESPPVAAVVPPEPAPEPASEPEPVADVAVTPVEVQPAIEAEAPAIKRWRVKITEPLPKEFIAEAATRDEAVAQFNAYFKMKVRPDKMQISEV